MYVCVYVCMYADAQMRADSREVEALKGIVDSNKDSGEVCMYVCMYV
jgi:hypothetical protein